MAQENQEVPTIETGIYRHFKKGDLYFVERVEQDADFNDVRWRICYHALYPGKPPLSRSIEHFDDVVDKETGAIILNTETSGKRFVRRLTLIQPLATNKMQMLLPGTKLVLACWFTAKNESRFGTHQVVRVFMKEKNVMVEYFLVGNQQALESLEISEFLKRFIRRES